jgi:hypothetical protein
MGGCRESRLTRRSRNQEGVPQRAEIAFFLIDMALHPRGSIGRGMIKGDNGK